MNPLIPFVCLALGCGVFFWHRFQTLFNPPALCAFSLGGSCALAIFFDALVKSGYVIHAGFVAPTGQAAVVYLVGLGSFLLPWIGVERKPHGMEVCKDKRLNRTILQLSALVLMLLLTTWLWLGRIALWDMLTSRYSINDHIASLQNLPSGLMILNLAGSTALSLYVASRCAYPRLSLSAKVAFTIVILVLFMASVWQGNRQLFLITMFFILARIFLKYTVTYGKLPEQRKIWRMRAFTFLAVIVFIGGFTLINYIRLSSEGRFSGPTEIFLYYSWPVYNMVSITSRIGFDGIGDVSFIFAELLPARLGGKDVVGQMAKFLFEPTSPSGYFAYWYFGLGLKGVAAGALIFSLACRYAFESSVRSEHHLRVYILILWTCAMAAVYSHFITLAYFWVPLAVLLMVNFVSRLTFVTAEPAVGER